MTCAAGCKLTNLGHFPCRNGRDQPLIIPTDGGKPVPYNRVTSYVGALEDSSGLIGWKQRMTTRGLALREDLYRSAQANTEDPKELSRIAAAAASAGGSDDKANLGTAIHGWTEDLDRGVPSPAVPAEYVADVMAYEFATQDMEHLAIERFCVLDGHKIAGTPDRISTFEGDTYIVDLKTGSIDYPGKMAMQLAVYAHSLFYNPDNTREHLPHVNRERGIIIHLPAGSGVATLHWIDIAAGWRAVEDLVRPVKAWRSLKGLTTPVSS